MARREETLRKRRGAVSRQDRASRQGGKRHGDGHQGRGIVIHRGRPQGWQGWETVLPIQGNTAPPLPRLALNAPSPTMRAAEDP
jgi:hypothetical protein